MTISLTNISFFVEPNKVTKEVREHLEGSGKLDDKIIYHPYESIKDKLEELVKDCTGKIWVKFDNELTN